MHSSCATTACLDLAQNALEHQNRDFSSCHCEENSISRLIASFRMLIQILNIFPYQRQHKFLSEPPSTIRLFDA